MKDYIIKAIKKSIEAQNDSWAAMYMVKKFHEGKKEAASKKEVASAEFQMKKCEDQKEFLTKLLAEEEAK